MQRYDSYKDSGVKWLGEIPSHWEVGKIKNLCQSIYAGGTPSSNNTNYWDGNIPWIPSGCCHDCLINDAPKYITTLGYNNSSTKMIPKNTVVMAMTGATCSLVGYLTIDSCANQSVVSYINNASLLNSKYLFYLLQSMRKYILTFQSGGAQGGINVNDCKNLYIPIVPLCEQNNIAEYLDSAILKIDNVIYHKQKMIDLLNERKQIIINQTLTKGLNSDAKMKDSGVEWIGMIPEDWEVVPMRRFIDVRDGTHDTPTYLPRSNNTYPLVTSKDFKDGEICLDDVKWISYNDFTEIDKRSHVDKYDVLTSMIGGNIGKSVIVNRDDKIAIKNVALFKTQGDYKLAKFIYYYMIGGMIKIQVEINSRGGAQSFLGLNDMRNLVYLNIPLKDRNKIVDYLDYRLERIDKSIITCNKQISLLQERKQIIINEVVTGKVKVI